MRAEASNNGVDFEGEEVWFEYTNAAQASMLMPSRGPVAGGMEVTVIGTGYAPGLAGRCMFGSAAAVAQVLNSTAVVCVTPVQEIPARVMVHVEGAWRPNRGLLL